MLEDTAVLMVVPELDDISTPAQQHDAFERLTCPKRMYLAEGKRHLTVLSGQGSEHVLKAMVNFFADALHGRVE